MSEVKTAFYLNILANGKYRVRCPRCHWCKDFSTESGALTEYCLHSIKEHRIRPLFKEPTRHEV